MNRFPRLPIPLVGVRRLFWPRRFPRLRRFPRYPDFVPGMCYCGKKARMDLFCNDVLLNDNTKWRGFCSPKCYDVYASLAGRSYHWTYGQFDDIISGRKDPGFYLIKRFPRRKK